jgi:hypothetical protein
MRDDCAITREGYLDSTMASESICLVAHLAVIKVQSRFHHTDVMARRRILTPDLQSHRVGRHGRDFKPASGSLRKHVLRTGGVRSRYVFRRRCRRRLGPQSARDHEKQTDGAQRVNPFTMDHLTK